MAPRPFPSPSKQADLHRTLIEPYYEHLQLADYTAAEQLLEDSARTPQLSTIPVILALRGNLARIAGDLELAAAYFDESRRYDWTRQPPSERSRLFSLLASLDMDSHRLTEAEVNLLEARHLSRQGPLTPQNKASLYLKLASLAFFRKDFRLAIRRAHATFAYARTLNLKSIAFLAGHNLVLYLSAADGPDAGLAFLDRLDQVLPEPPIHHRPQHVWLRARLAHQVGDEPQATENYELALELAVTIERPVLAARILLDRSRSLFLQQRPLIPVLEQYYNRLSDAGLGAEGQRALGELLATAQQAPDSLDAVFNAAAAFFTAYAVNASARFRALA